MTLNWCFLRMMPTKDMKWEVTQELPRCGQPTWLNIFKLAPFVVYCSPFISGCMIWRSWKWHFIWAQELAITLRRNNMYFPGALASFTGNCNIHTVYFQKIDASPAPRTLWLIRCPGPASHWAWDLLMMGSHSERMWHCLASCRCSEQYLKCRNVCLQWL